MKAWAIAWLGLVATTFAAVAAPKHWETENHRPLCEPNSTDTVADFSMHVTDLRLPNGQPVWDKLRSFGIKTIVRYYDWQDESQDCKTLFADEANTIFANKFDLAVVFQHFNGSPETFIDVTRGKKDANRSLDLAEHNGQPPATTIYFGVDGPDQVIVDVTDEYARSNGPMSTARRKLLLTPTIGGKKNPHYNPDLVRHYDRFLAYRVAAFGPSLKDIREKFQEKVRAYFTSIDEVFTARGGGKARYEIGAYGSGSVCLDLLKQKLVARCWLAQSTGWPKYKEFANEAIPRWSLLQKNPTFCSKWSNIRPRSEQPGFDFNIVNSNQASFGQWSQILTSTRELPRPARCPTMTLK